MWTADARPLLLALEALARHRLRTALSVAGVVCGVAVALATAAVNDGARRTALAEIARLGPNIVIVRSRPPVTLTARDVAAIVRLVPFVRSAVPLRHLELRASGPHGAITTAVLGSTSDYVRARPLDVVRGRFLRVDEDDRGPRVCVLGETVARALFAYDDPIGDSVKVAGDWYRVVGILGASDLDRTVVVPLAALSGRALSADADQPLDEIRMQVTGERQMQPAAAEVSRLLARLHSARPADYEVAIPQQLLDHRTSTQRLFNTMSVTMAVLLLALGGIGIMSTMLTAVFDRTREIGLRRAVGATRRDILGQFLAEAAAIAVSGGIAGVIVGLVVSVAIARAAAWPIAISPWRIVVVLGLAAAVGLVSGVYPALKAADTEPIRAVMHE
jgi:putative ABC transport system permease protein